MISPSDRAESGPPADDDHHGARRLVMIGSVVSVVLTIGVLVVAFVLVSRASSEPDTDSGGPLAVPAAPAPGASGHWCATLDAALPDDLVSLPRRDLANPSPGVAAWGDPAVILRCGLDDPAELTCYARLTQFTDPSGTSVSWLQLSDPSAVTYIAVDRPVRVAVTLPSGVGVGPIQQLSEVISSALPANPVCSNDVVTPMDNG